MSGQPPAGRSPRGGERLDSQEIQESPGASRPHALLFLVPERGENPPLPSERPVSFPAQDIPLLREGSQAPWVWSEQKASVLPIKMPRGKMLSCSVRGAQERCTPASAYGHPCLRGMGCSSHTSPCLVQAQLWACQETRGHDQPSTRVL